MDRTEIQAEPTLYQNCPPWALHLIAGQDVAVIGKVIEINQQEETIVLETDPQAHVCLRVEVPRFTMRYLFNQRQMKLIQDRDASQLIDRIIHPQKYIPKPESEGNKSESRYNEWFVVKEDKDRLPENQMVVEKQQENQPFQEPEHRIHAGYFTLNQYLQVRGRGLDSCVLQLQQFTNLEYDFDLSTYNEIQRIIIANCSELIE